MQVTGETAPQGLTGRLLNKATQSRLGDVSDLPNTKRQTQRGCHNKETNMAPIKEEKKMLEKQLNKWKTSNLPHTEFKTMVKRTHKDLTENFNKEIASIKGHRGLTRWLR